LKRAGFRLFIRRPPRRGDLDTDDLEFPDPYPNPEETLLAMEAVVGRGFWTFGTPREEEPTLKADRDTRHKYRGIYRPSRKDPLSEE